MPRNGYSSGVGFFNLFYFFWWWWGGGGGIGLGVDVIENVIKAMQLLAEKCKYMQNFTNNFRRFNNH